MPLEIAPKFPKGKFLPATAKTTALTVKPTPTPAITGVRVTPATSRAFIRVRTPIGEYSNVPAYEFGRMTQEQIAKRYGQT